jgi:NAD(P)-dependent dehydrogenase (short-subunit alcohol dehydrogenase family)
VCGLTSLAGDFCLSFRCCLRYLCGENIGAFGGLDILVVNAGVHYDRRRVEDSQPEDWRATLEVNLLGAYYIISALMNSSPDLWSPAWIRRRTGNARRRCLRSTANG